MLRAFVSVNLYSNAVCCNDYCPFTAEAVET